MSNSLRHIFEADYFAMTFQSGWEFEQPNEFGKFTSRFDEEQEQESCLEEFYVCVQLTSSISEALQLHNSFVFQILFEDDFEENSLSIVRSIGAPFQLIAPTYVVYQVSRTVLNIAPGAIAVRQKESNSVLVGWSSDESAFPEHRLVSVLREDFALSVSIGPYPSEGGRGSFAADVGLSELLQAHMLDKGWFSVCFDVRGFGRYVSARELQVVSPSDIVVRHDGRVAL